MMASQAQSFLAATGWGGYYNAEEDDWAEDFRDDLVKKQEKGGYGFSESDANRIVSSVNAVYAGSPEGLLGIAEELHGLLMPDEKGERRKLSASEQKFVTGFDPIGIVDKQKDTGIVTVAEEWAQSLDDISSTLKNKRSIMQEMYEFGEGEFEIQRDIGLTEDVKLPTFKLPGKGEEGEEGEEGILNLSDLIKSESTDTVTNINQNINRLADEISLRKGESLTAQYQINQFENSMRQLDILASTGAKMTPTQQSLLITENREGALAKLEEKVKTTKDELVILSEELHKQELARNKIQPQRTYFRDIIGLPLTTKEREKKGEETMRRLLERGLPSTL
tara:strand:+ start:34 stop:1041 length:1008 start_codon:yes stop_codon:yes gene_type:complete